MQCGSAKFSDFFIFVTNYRLYVLCILYIDHIRMDKYYNKIVEQLNFTSWRESKKRSMQRVGKLQWG